ncbi:MAG TPA: OsmC family protein [Steroidobacteraceae bacterium]|nr:OsmC family protein [Steroidobacteraceae bacterium]
MTTATIASAVQRVRSVFARRPDAALHADEPAIARWEQGLRVVSRHANGARITTDLPRELGGQGEEVTPGWLLRAALASCLATRIALEAAVREIVITSLEVAASSESDARGLFGMSGDAGERIPPGPRALQLRVRVAAPNVAAETLRTMIEESRRCSPVQFALERSVPVSVQIDIDPV